MNKVSIHRQICEELNITYEKKNQDYGDSYSKSFEEFGPVMCAIRLDDKLNRFKTLIKGQATPQVDESIEDTLLDLANYAIMAAMEMRALRNKKTIGPNNISAKIPEIIMTTRNDTL